MFTIIVPSIFDSTKPVQLKRSPQTTQKPIRVQLTSILNVENVTGKIKQPSLLSKSVSSALPSVCSNLGTLHGRLFSYVHIPNIQFMSLVPVVWADDVSHHITSITWHYGIAIFRNADGDDGL